MAFFSGGGQKAGFEFFKHFIKQQFDSSRMYQTIRVIRPKPKESSMDSYLSSMKQMPPSRMVMFAVMSGLGGSSMVYILADFGVFDSLTSKGSGNLTVQEQEKRKLTGREKRFIKFASVEYNGQIYMTPQDFLDSVVEGEPRPRFKRKKLTESEVKNMMRRMPKLHRNNEKFFRGLGSKGIISFSEYLFLLTILIKPQSGFKIAFAMLDQDGNERVDKEEFKVLETVFSSAARERREQEKNQQNSENNNDDEEEKGNKEGEETSEEEANKKTHLDLDIFDDSDHGLTRSHNVDSSLLIYFFGRRGDAELCFEDFRKFMDNLQTEVLQMEYDEFAKGAQSITEVDFARILLRYTFLSSQEYKSILARLVDRLEDEAKNSKDGVLALKGITFQEFKDFCFFLNNLDDFQIAMKMYTLADHAIKPEEFSRAATICSGKVLSPYVVKTVYQIFDSDGDGMLSYEEFIAIMKDRVNRGLKTFSRQEGWAGFKRCVKQELRSKAA